MLTYIFYLILTLTFDQDGVCYCSRIFEGSKWRDGGQGGGHSQRPACRHIILRAHTPIIIIAGRTILEFPGMTVLSVTINFSRS